MSPVRHAGRGWSCAGRPLRWALLCSIASAMLDVQAASGAARGARARGAGTGPALESACGAGAPDGGCGRGARHGGAGSWLGAGIDTTRSRRRCCAPLRLRGAGRGLSDSTSDGCLNPLLVTLLTCILSPRMMWHAEKHVPYMPGDHGDVLWGTEDMDAHDSFDTLTAGLNQRIGSLPTPTIEHSAIRRRRQLGAGGFAVVFEADIPGQGKKGGGWSRTCACKVFSFIAGMGERQTNFFKNWLHELKVLEYLTNCPECGVVDFYGFSLRHEEAEAKIVVQICMELMRGGSLRDNLLVLKRKGEKVPLAVAYNIMRQIACALRGLHKPVHDVFLTNKKVSIVHRDLKPENVLLSEKLTGAPQPKSSTPSILSPKFSTLLLNPQSSSLTLNRGRVQAKKSPVNPWAFEGDAR